MLPPVNCIKETLMMERKGLVTVHGNPLTLEGQEIKVGDMAPNFEVVGNDLQPVKFSSYNGRVLILLSVPSLDTPVCDLETRRFNAEAAQLGPEIAVLTISMDLPFAQKRWCGTHGVDRVVTLSDHRTAGFGLAYGVLIKELRLLARAALVIDKQGVIQYQEIVPELGQEPNYEAILEVTRKLLA